MLHYGAPNDQGIWSFFGRVHSCKDWPLGLIDSVYWERCVSAQEVLPTSYHRRWCHQVLTSISSRGGPWKQYSWGDKEAGSPARPKGFGLEKSTPSREAERSFARSGMPSCQYPDNKLMVVNYLQPQRWSTNSRIYGIGNASRLETALTLL